MLFEAISLQQHGEERARTQTYGTNRGSAVRAGGEESPSPPKHREDQWGCLEPRT